MREAVIVSTARTPIGRAFKGAFNATKSPTLVAHAIRNAVARSGVDGREIEDVVIGCVLAAGTAGSNIARFASIAAGLPFEVSGQTIDRQCSSGLMAIATAAKQIVHDGMDIAVAGGHDNISMVQNAYTDWVRREADPNVTAAASTPTCRCCNCGVRRGEIWDQARGAGPIRARISASHRGRAKARAGSTPKSSPSARRMEVVDRATGERSLKEITLTKDEGNRPEHHVRGSARSEAGHRRRRRHGGQREPTLGRRFGLRDHGIEDCGKTRTATFGDLSRHGRRRLRSGGDGDRPGLRRAEAPGATRPEGRRYRALGVE